MLLLVHSESKDKYTFDSGTHDFLCVEYIEGQMAKFQWFTISYGLECIILVIITYDFCPSDQY